MMNAFTVVGRINKKERDKVYISVTRYFKNVHGDYVDDIIPVKICGSVGVSINNYCNIGDIVGVRGYIRQLENSSKIVLQAEKISFLGKGD